MLECRERLKSSHSWHREKKKILESLKPSKLKCALALAPKNSYKVRNRHIFLLHILLIVFFLLIFIFSVRIRRRKIFTHFLNSFLMILIFFHFLLFSISFVFSTRHDRSSVHQHYSYVHCCSCCCSLHVRWPTEHPRHKSRNPHGDFIKEFSSVHFSFLSKEENCFICSIV